MEKKTSQMRKLQLELQHNSISLRKFLIHCCGACNESILKENLSHKDIKYLFPELKRVSFESLIYDKRKLYTDEVVAVEDSYGNIIPYENPKTNDYDYDCEIEYNEDENNKKYKEVEELIIDENLSLYELSVLCKKLKSEKRYREYRIAYRLLKKAKDPSIKEYKQEKFKQKVKGREEYEEY